MKLCFPEKILEQHAAVLGKTGAGKSSALRHVVEHLLQHGKRVCVIDPKGDWWGLRLGADGKSPGFPLVTFGDFKGDYAGEVPINQHSGKHVAELITSGNRPAIIGFRGWFTAHMLNFWIDFAKTLFHTNEGELYLIIDETQNFAPKGSTKNVEGQGGLALHWTNRLLAEGRGLGINIWIGSQRPQKVHNDTLDGCETLIAMRTVHPAARAALVKWMEGSGDKNASATILDAIGTMPRGEAYIWSPEIEFGPKRVAFPMFTTFDSFAPPQLQKKVSKRTWDDVDLDEVKAKLASVIKEAEAKDPKALRARIATLEAELLKRPEEIAPDPKVEIREVPVLKDDERAAILRLDEVLSGLDLQGIKDSIGVVRRHLVSPTLPKISEMHGVLSRPTDARIPALKTAAPPRINQNGGSNGEVPSGGMKRMMIALAQRPGLSARQLGLRSGLSSKSGTFGTYVSNLRKAGWIEGDKARMQLTTEGVSSLGSYTPLPEGRGLYEHWRGELGNSGAARMLEALFEAYPQALTKEELGERASISSSSGTFGTYLSTLRKLELIIGGDELKASEEFFQ